MTDDPNYDSRFVPHPYIKDEVRKGGEVRIRVTGEPEIKELWGAKINDA